MPAGLMEEPTALDTSSGTLLMMAMYQLLSSCMHQQPLEQPCGCLIVHQKKLFHYFIPTGKIILASLRLQKPMCLLMSATRSRYPESAQPFQDFRKNRDVT